MSKLWAKLSAYISNRTFAGIDKSGNRYFTRIEEIDGIVKEKRWVIFKGEQEPTSVPVEWICWLNGQRKKAPTPEEMDELEARREQVKLNVARLKREEEEERKAKSKGGIKPTPGKATGPDLKSFIQQFPTASKMIDLGKQLMQVWAGIPNCRRLRLKLLMRMKKRVLGFLSHQDLDSPLNLEPGNLHHDPLS